ncbi:MAG: dihydroorotase [Desulfobacteraceae bacterium]|nr:dihydroorotase [Desulfobacteraceae bacterium]MBC2757066.1 dihydroorotase [Desulfobacteraceae bacterium]MBC2763717.1 dihydroorotase [ANME-2 cluster archaeon]
MRLIIKGGHVLDPGNIDVVTDIKIDDGIITDLKKFESDLPDNDTQVTRIIDAGGCFVVPGLIDMHVHLRDPGQEYKESIETGIHAAAAGGFTAVCCMPNTNPVNDNRQVTEYIIKTAGQFHSVKVYPVASISRGLKGLELSEYGELKEAGAVAVSDDGLPVSDSQLMRRSLEYAKGVGLKVISHCEDPNLSAGAMNEGLMATRMGLAGIPNASESIMVMRDIALCELTGTPVHIAHVSTKESVHAIRDAKSRGVPVTAETAPHYFTLTDEAVRKYNTNAKMNPPLRSIVDRDEIRKGLADGTIDVIATDHAPHSVLEKEVEFDRAANGIIGLETSLSLGLKLVEEGVITFETLICKMSKNPSKIIGLSRDISVGAPADLTIINPTMSHTYDVEKGFSKSKNSPFNGWEFKGMAVYAIVNGRVVFESK